MGPVLSIAIFVVFGLLFVLLTLAVGRLVRPRLSTTEKQAIYECGETPIGTSWVQFDLRFYIVALFYLVFDVEVALLYPWAVHFREHRGEALILGLPFLAVVIVGFIYEWYAGSLEWVRAAPPGPPPAADSAMAHLARRDPESLMPQASAAPRPAV